MVWHPAKGKHFPSTACHLFLEPARESIVVSAIVKDLSTPIAPSHDMVDRTRKLNTKLTCHRRALATDRGWKPINQSNGAKTENPADPAKRPTTDYSNRYQSVSLLKQVDDKESIAMRRRMAGWNPNFLAKVLGIPTT